MSRFDAEIASSASAAQQSAAHPDYSVFVEANAGSGKTRVLVDRVVNILLRDTRPDSILCVTYTKAAAAEMKDRLFERLGKWSIASDEVLKKELANHTVDVSAPGALARARRLFALALETPGGLKIQTIHAFCESLLRRFPLEAGAMPGFETLDDEQAREIEGFARRDILPDLPRSVIATLLDAGGPDAISQIIQWAISNRHHLREVEARSDGAGAMITALADTLGVAGDLTIAGFKAQVWAETPKDELRAAARALVDLGSVKDIGRGEVLLEALDCRDPVQAFNLYLSKLFNEGGVGPRPKYLVTNSVKEAAPSVGPFLEAEAERLEAARDTLRSIQVLDNSRAALALALPYLKALQRHRDARRALDFDDLIVLAGDLLRPENEFSGWVGYKLDGALAHALIDEAQDTSPRQWDMIRGLTAEFFAGEGAQERSRSLFVVGDEKQSIYSFQGADPAGFIAEGDRLHALTQEAGMDFHRPGLDVSFRSAPEVLAAVDTAFADYQFQAPEQKFANEQLPRAFSAYRTHRAARSGTPGCVEFWPAVPQPEKREPESIFDPLDALPRGSARDVLARVLAREVRGMLDRGDAVWEESRGRFHQRPVEPRDIGILVWRRTGGFFEELIRQLKLAGVPVAGADRMVLRDQTVVKDLLALGRFAVSSSDDLALAEVLKSPFFDPDDGGRPPIDDAALTDLAQARPTTDRGGLWRALLRTEDARFAEAREALKRFRDQAETTGLYALFAGFLNARSVTGETRWTRVFARLSEEARDPAEEFLARALEFERREGSQLGRFIAHVGAEEMAIKRELSTDRNEVQIMTVHASKGLERPVIILPDTTRSPLSHKSAGLFTDDRAGLVWSPRKKEDPALLSMRREMQDLATLAEHDRLLYVALTRARDRLIVCGWMQGTGRGKVEETSWHARLARQWGGEGWSTFETPLSAELDEIDTGLRFGTPPGPVETGKHAGEVTPPRPDWLDADLPDDSASARAVTPSSLIAKDEVDPAVYSPLGDRGAYRFRRGEVIHKLLETLPALSETARRDAAERYLAAQSDLEAGMRAAILAETLGILDHPDFAPLFGPGSRAEVSLSGWAPGLPPGSFVRGQVDRLLVRDHDVLIIDYKTNRPPPERVADVPVVYLGQMAAYKALLEALHPQKQVRCALLWTDAACLMELPSEQMEQALTGALP